MKLTVVGSADAFNASGRGHSCYLVQSEAAGDLMLDFGPTALLGMRRAGLQPERIDGVAFTHLHGDHIGGFPFLVIDGLYNAPRARALEVIGPGLTGAVLETLLDSTYPETKQQLAKVVLPVQELAPGEHCQFVGYRLEAFAAVHMRPPHRPLCLRVIDPAGRSIAFSGDTSPCPGLFAAADAVDLLVAECTRLAPPAGQHCTWEDWRTTIPGLTAKAILLTHLGEDVREALPRLRVESRGPVQFAEDGMVVDIGS
jgi:ribonuclease BN (tRNA processing enzyme)